MMVITGTMLLGVLETIGSIVGIIITLITFFTLISKRPLQAFRKMIREESEAATAPIKKDVEELKERMKSNDEVDLVLLRNTITHIYIKYCKEEKIPHYEKENVKYLYEQYQAKGGNSYVKSITKKMDDWEEIF